MANRRRDFDSGELEQGIARLRNLAEQIGHAHDLIARNTELLSQDRAAIRAGALRAVDNFARADDRPSALALDEDRPGRRARAARSRRR